MGGLGGTVAIIGTGTIKFGENFHQSLTDMIFEAVKLAMADAKIESRQLQANWVGCYEPFLYGFEGNSGTFVSDPLNLFPILVTRVAAYCATGIEAVRNAALAVASLPINTSGGLKSCGHAIGSSGIRMINNVRDQLLGRAGKMQVQGANMGLARNLGGPGSVSAVAALSQP